MSLAEARLYGILDLGYVAPADLERTAERMCAGGVDVLQLRAKHASDLEIESYAQRIAPIVSAAGIPFLLNDFPELVPSSGAQGAHVGQDDLPIAEARWRAGRSLGGELPPPIIGKSTHSVSRGRRGGGGGRGLPRLRTALSDRDEAGAPGHRAGRISGACTIW